MRTSNAMDAATHRHAPQCTETRLHHSLELRVIKVLHLRDTNRVCGPGKTILETACRIDQQHFSIAIGLLMLESEQRNLYYEAAEARGIEVHALRTKSQFSPKIVHIVETLVRDGGFDIVHSHEYKSDIIAALVSLRCGVPIVTTAHGWITNSAKSKAYIWAGKQVFRFFDKVIAVSPRIRQEVLRNGARPERVELVYNAIRVEDYIPSDYPKGYLRSRFSIPDSATLIGNVGRLSPEKGQIEFLRAARPILGRNPGVYFVLVGDGPDRINLEHYVRSEGLSSRVFFAGHEKDIRPVFRDLDALALTSYTEGFPNVVLEALCMDTPVLATDVGGVSSIIADRETGVLVPPYDFEAVERGLSWILNHPAAAQKMVLRGKELIKERFEFSKRVEKVQDIYRSIGNRHPTACDHPWFSRLTQSLRPQKQPSGDSLRRNRATGASQR